MHLLPPTSRGTRLLAFAAWIGLCAATWMVFPVKPRAEWTLPQPGAIIGFTPDQNLLVTANRGLDPPPTSADQNLYGPIRLWDPESHRLVREYAGPTGHFNSATLSRTGRWLALANYTADDRPVEDPALWLLDLTDGQLTRSPAFRGKYATSCIFGQNDRWLICSVNGHAERVSVPDLTTTGQPPAHWFCYTLAAGGQTLADRGDVETGEPNGIVIRDAATFAVKAVIPRPDLDIEHLGLNADGSVLAADAVLPAELSWKGKGPEVRLWDTGTGRELLRVPTPFFSLCPDGRTLLTTPYEDMAADWTVWDVQSATRRFVLAPPSGATTYPIAIVSPDGRTAGLYVGWPAGHPFAGWAKRLGLKWPWENGPQQRATAFFDLATGESLGAIPDLINPSHWSADSKQVAGMDGDHLRVRIWDVPPRRSLTWFAAVAGLLALPVALAAWWRTRRLGIGKTAGLKS
jgi:WD40 repeat protein